jgi:hypothetical protein
VEDGSLTPMRLTMPRGGAVGGLGVCRRQRSCGEHSAVGPSQHPILKWQRGHCKVACRHSIAVPHRQHGSCCAVAIVDVLRSVAGSLMSPGA